MKSAQYFRGARVSPKPPKSMADDLSYPKFLFAMAGVCVTDYGIKDRALFLTHCGMAFDAALEISSTAMKFDAQVKP